MNRRTNKKTFIISIFVILSLLFVMSTNARIDLTGRGSVSSDGGNIFDQDLNTTSFPGPTFTGLTLDSDLDMNTNDISNVNDLTVDNDITLNDKLEHLGDGDTYLDFDANQIRLYAGGTTILNMVTTLATFGVNVTIDGNTLNVTDGYMTDTGTGWSGWIDDGVNTNCTYRYGIIINVGVTAGVAGFRED